MTGEHIAKLKGDIVFTEQLAGEQLTFHSTWGLFSPREVDEGSRLLVNNITIAPNASIIDVGCGYGPIGLTLARRAPQGEVHLVDKDFVAVAYAKKNAAANRLANCRIYLSNGFSAVPKQQFDFVVSNLPAKVGNELLTIIMHDAKARLRIGGELYVVVIAGLKPYIKRNFEGLFGNYKKVKQGKTYLVAKAVKEAA